MLGHSGMATVLMGSAPTGRCIFFLKTRSHISLQKLVVVVKYNRVSVV